MAFSRRGAQEALEALAATGSSLRPLFLAHLAISSKFNPIYARSAPPGNGLRYLCEICAGGGQGSALTNTIFPTAINGALNSTERDHCVEMRAQQDGISIFGEPAEVFGPGKALETILAKLAKAGLEPNKKKFQVLGTTGDACAEKPEEFDETFVVTDPVASARVGATEAEATATAAAAAAASPERRSCRRDHSRGE